MGGADSNFTLYPETYIDDDGSIIVSVTESQISYYAGDITEIESVEEM
jgi:hypothetical protein